MKLIINDFFKNMTVEDVLISFNLSKTNIYKLKTNNKILVNGLVMPMDSLVEFGDEMTVDTSELDDAVISPSNKIVKVIYEDDYLIIVEKERGVLVHSDGVTVDTLLNRLAYYYRFKNEEVTLRVVHRIDTQTTGLVVFSKNLLSSSYLSNLFESNLVTKKYLALVWGLVKTDEGLISSPISRDRHSNKQRISNKGKEAVTEYKVLERMSDKTLLEIEIKGGRRHQIRVHLESIGHPIVGDEIYGKQDKKDMMLKFYEISFIHPRTRVPFSCSLPKTFLKK